MQNAELFSAPSTEGVGAAICRPLQSPLQSAVFAAGPRPRPTNAPSIGIRSGELRSPADIPLSEIGLTVDNEIKKLNTVYDAVRVDKYCIMPDHIHFIVSINTDTDGRTQFAPTSVN